MITFGCKQKYLHELQNSALNSLLSRFPLSCCLFYAVYRVNIECEFTLGMVIKAPVIHLKRINFLLLPLERFNMVQGVKDMVYGLKSYLTNNEIHTHKYFLFSYTSNSPSTWGCSMSFIIAISLSTCKE